MGLLGALIAVWGLVFYFWMSLLVWAIWVWQPPWWLCGIAGFVVGKLVEGTFELIMCHPEAAARSKGASGGASKGTTGGGVEGK